MCASSFLSHHCRTSPTMHRPSLSNASPRLSDPCGTSTTLLLPLPVQGEGLPGKGYYFFLSSMRFSSKSQAENHWPSHVWPVRDGTVETP